MHLQNVAKCWTNFQLWKFAASRPPQKRSPNAFQAAEVLETKMTTLSLLKRRVPRIWVLTKQSFFYAQIWNHMQVNISFPIPTFSVTREFLPPRAKYIFLLVFLLPSGVSSYVVVVVRMWHRGDEIEILLTKTIYTVPRQTGFWKVPWKQMNQIDWRRKNIFFLRNSLKMGKF